MPFVQIYITREEATPRQKSAVISGVTEVLRRELGKDPQLTRVLIHEMDPENWGVAGLPVPEYRRITSG